jgi:GntR family transcriptional regulator
VPVDVQIADNIEGDIRTGRLQQHDRIPTESNMHAEYDVARTTARRAWAYYGNEGWSTASCSEAPSGTQADLR